MKKLLGNIAGTLCGLLTAVLTAFVVFALGQLFGFPLYSFTLFFIVPIGAILAGFLAASGYYIAFSVFKARPTKVMFVIIVGISIGTFFLIHYLDYRVTTVDGQSISNFIPFQTYLTAALENTSLSLHLGSAPLGSTGSMGAWGYVVAAIHILGFSVGGFGVYGAVMSNPYCERCSRYLSLKALQERYYSSEAEKMKGAEGTSRLIEEGRYQEAVDGHAQIGVRNDGHGRLWRSVITVKACDKCDRHWIQLSQDHEVNGNWQPTSATPLERYSESPVAQRA